MDKPTTNIIKALCVLMVLLQHYVFAVQASFYGNEFANSILLFRGDVAVAVVVFLSGYALSESFGRKELDGRVLLKRLLRLTLPMVVTLMLFWVLIANLGAWGFHFATIGYEWGYLSPIGMLGEVSIESVWDSFLNLFYGENLNLLLVSWLLKHELMLSVWLFMYCLIEQSIHKNIRQFSGAWRIVFPALFFLISIWQGLAYGVYAAFWLGVMWSRIRHALSVSRVYLALISCVAYVAIILARSGGDEWKIALINSDIEWLVYLLTDVRYALYALIVPAFVIAARILARIAFVETGLMWIGERAYSVYLMSQLALQISVFALYKLESYLAPISFFVVVLLLTLSMAHCFHYVIDRHLILSRESQWKWPSHGFVQDAKKMLGR